MKRKRPSTGKIVNRRARFDYELGDDLVVGIKLNGRETKSLRQGHAHLRGSFITIKDNQLILSNATIASGKTFIIPENEQTQARILLAKHKEIDALKAAKDSGKSIVPLEFLTQGRYVKLRIAVGKGKKRYDKRQTIKERDQARDIRNLA
jgi:SsrA-binding protein